MKFKLFFLFISISLFLSLNTSATVFKNVVLKIDTSIYSLKNSDIKYSIENTILFEYTNDDEVCEVNLYPDEASYLNTLELIASSDYKIIDSLININNEYLSCKIRFINITKSNFLSLRFKKKNDTTNWITEIKLQPYTRTSAVIVPTSDELLIGEEKIFELISNNPENIRITNEWTTGLDIDYRITYINKQLQLHVIPNTLGKKFLKLNFQFYKPSLTAKGLTYDSQTSIYSFNIKSGRLVFLNLDKKDITFDDVSRKEGIEIQIDNSRGLLMQKTYRIEAQEEPGGMLYAELFTRQSISTEKIICLLRVYNYHKQSDGYLYIKDGDNARFITNFDITPKTTISKISILRSGLEWNESNVVYPGETINVKIEGESLSKGKFAFEDIDKIFEDSVLINDHQAEFKITIPLNISKKKISIYNRNENTGMFLSIKEYQQPKEFNYIKINYGNISKDVNSISVPEMHKGTLKNITLTFLPDKIDETNKLYGKQYLQLSVKVTNSKGELIEMLSLPAVTLCPGSASPRSVYYDKRGCNTDWINLNQYLNRKTYDLEEWAKISINIKHDKDKYNGEGLEKNVDIYLQRSIKFDVDVSFPSLLTKVVKEEGWQNGLGGISMAIIAQFSFYEKDKINRFMPYKLGVGFLALNAFNFSPDNTYRDLGIVVLGSLYPTRKESKFSFPLYIGGGYLINKSSWFWVLGPGIRVSF